MSECDPIDACFVASLLCLCLGIISSSLGLVVNTEYEVDPDMAARDMEQVERYYERLILFLRMCDIFGISMVTTGACLLLLAVVVMAIKGEFSSCTNATQEIDEQSNSGCHGDKNGKRLPLLGRSIGNRFHGYGSNEPSGK